MVVSPHWPGWRWHAEHFPDIAWDFFDDRGWALWTERFGNLARVRGCLRAVLRARQTGAMLLATHEPTTTALVASFCELFRIRVPIVAMSFNFAKLPSAWRRRWLARELRRVDRFVVYSSAERELYARAFDLPIERFENVLWSVSPPRPRPGAPAEPREYAIAIGGNGRDYRVLLDAARLAPEVPLTLVVRPENLRGLDAPPHVRVHTNLPLDLAMNLLAHARFMVLPLWSSDVPCGHVTLVSAMFLERAFIVTDSSGVRDYALPGHNCLTVPERDAQGLAEAMRRLWRDPDACARLGAAGRTFALRHCSEAGAIAHLGRLLECYQRG